MLLHDINGAVSALLHSDIDCGIGTNDCTQSEWHLPKLKQFETVVQCGA